MWIRGPLFGKKGERERENRLRLVTQALRGRGGILVCVRERSVWGDLTASEAWRQTGGLEGAAWQWEDGRVSVVLPGPRIGAGGWGEDRRQSGRVCRPPGGKELRAG